eukprot:CAMPEP_0201578052 /NCGR_PEP_ID=MMETSP0190_2-20130828/24728_1 /ASSEMBLY_ACC=CAM_ASM_000263 /TAXON_ID=37353 /ORGANISM="Rosalina sp." /LENGTH=366 /DNA_ID=CAMNT_0048010801 /DNA_START=165 /DNA_END=1265 /DNA_ORIENTATION=-
MILSTKILTLEKLCELHKSKYERIYAENKVKLSNQEDKYKTNTAHLKAQIKNLYATIHENLKEFRSFKEESVATENNLKLEIQQYQSTIRHHIATINDLKDTIWDNDLDISSLKIKLSKKDMELQRLQKQAESECTIEPYLPSPSALKIPHKSSHSKSINNNLRPKLKDRYSKSRSISKSRYSYSVSRVQKPKIYTNQTDNPHKFRKSISYASTAFRFRGIDLEQELDNLDRALSIETSLSTNGTDIDSDYDDESSKFSKLRLRLDAPISELKIDMGRNHDGTVTPLDYDKNFEDAYGNINARAFKKVLPNSENEYLSECEFPSQSDISRSRKSVSSFRSRMIEPSHTQMCMDINVVVEELEDHTH